MAVVGKVGSGKVRDFYWQISFASQELSDVNCIIIIIIT